MKQYKQLNKTQLIGSVLTLLGLSACGQKTDSSANPIKKLTTYPSTISQSSKGSSGINGSPSYVTSESTQSKFETVISALNGIKSQKQALCPIDESLLKALEKQLDTIQKNKSLSDSQKQQAAGQVFKENKSTLDSIQTKVQACISKNHTAWQLIVDNEKDIVESCLPKPPQNQGGNGINSQQQGPPPPPLPGFEDTNSSQVKELENTLNSNSCTSLFR